jgi:hypothetical protein
LKTTVTGPGTNSSDTASNAPSGGMVGVNFGWLGIVYEDYTASKSYAASSSFVCAGTNSKIEVTMYDLLLNLPTPGINLALGAGTGTGHLSGTCYTGRTVKDADLTQYLVQLGIPFGALFDVHLAYRSFSGTNKISVPGATFDAKQEGNVYTLGIRIGF